MDAPALGASAREFHGNAGNGNNRQQTIDHQNRPKRLAKLLQRYGVVFRKLLDREAISVPWRDLLRVYRVGTRGEIRGGRFVGASR